MNAARFLALVPALTLISLITITTTTTPAAAQDWPQWLGPTRNARAHGFTPPKNWPETLTKKWSVPVGEGVATPALVNQRLYVFTRQNDFEILRCIDASSGTEIWQDRYESLGASGPAQSFSGPRSSPAVAHGKIITLGVRGILSCVDAATGKPLWRKDDFKAYPAFHPSSSPLIVSNLAIAQLGGRDNGAIAAYDLTSGDLKWRWNGPSPSYASPNLLTLGTASYVVAQTTENVVAINTANGRLAWELEVPPPTQNPPATSRGNRDYRAITPVLDGPRLFLAGRNLRALEFEQAGPRLLAHHLWANLETAAQFSTPTLKNGHLYGVTANNHVFCIRTEDGVTAWSTPFPSPPTPSPSPNTTDATPATPAPRRTPPGPSTTGYGTIVDAGATLAALTPAGFLVFFQPNDTHLESVAAYPVASTPTHAYPVLSGKRIYIKDLDSLTLWTFE